MSKKTGATPDAGDAGSTPNATPIEQATQQVEAMTAPLEGDPPPPRREPPKKVKGLERGTTSPVLQARMAQVESIAAQRRAVVAQEAGISVEEVGSPDAPINADPDADPDDAAAEAERRRLEQAGDSAPQGEPPAAAPPNAEPTLIEDPSKYRVRLKVDGQETVFSLADVVRREQKEQAADRRLAEATRLLSEARTTTAAPAEPAGEPNAKPPAAEPPQEDWKKRKKDFLDAIYSGDEERASAALDEVLAIGARGTATPAIDPTAITAVVRTELQRTAVSSALEKFNADFKDIVADPYLTDIANRFIANDLQGATLESLPKEQIGPALEKAGKATRDWVLQRATQYGARTDPTTRTDRTARKATIDEVPSVNATSLSTAQRPQTTQDVLQEMRKARGLAT
jgi:hypothetical protein